MRLTLLALAALVGSTSAFSTSPNVCKQKSSSQHVVMNLQKNEDIFDEAKNVIGATFTAATLFMGTMTPLSADIANAATATTAAPSTTTSTTTKKVSSAKKETPAPLSSEKAALDSAKAAYTATQKPLSDAKKVANEAQSTLNKATSARESLQKKTTELKKNLISVNDKLASAKKSGKSSTVMDVYGKEIATIKVSYYDVCCSMYDMGEDMIL